MVKPESIADRIWQSLGWRITDVAPVFAAMLVWARLIPEASETDILEAECFGFFDDRKELTSRGWSTILDVLRQKRAEHGDAWAFQGLEEISAKAEPGTLESLRQTIMDFFGKGTESNPDKVQKLAWMLVGATTDESPHLTKLIINTLRAEPNDSIYCGFDLSAPIALELAKHHPVFLQLPNTELARLMALLAIAGAYSLEVSCSHPIQDEHGDNDTPVPWLDKRNDGGTVLRSFDHAIALPPFGVRYSSEPIASDMPAKFGSASMADVLHISLVLARGCKRRVILVPDGFLFRTTKNEQIYKRKLILDYGLTSVISLPRGITSPTRGVSSSLLIFDAAHKSPEGSIRFVDGRSNWPSKSRFTNPQVVNYQLEALLALVNGHIANEPTAPVSADKLAANDFNLLVDRYVVDPKLRQQRQMLAKQQTIPLGDLVEFYRPQAFTPTPENRRPPLGQIIAMREVATGDIHDGIVEHPAKEIEMWAGDVDRIKRAILKPGDVLISVKGKVGVVGVVPEDVSNDLFFGDWVAGQTFVIARLRRSTMIKSPAVLARYLAAPFGQAQLQALAGGTTVPMIQMSDLRRLAIPLPTAEMQNKIARQIEHIKTLREQVRNIELQIQELEAGISHSFLGNGR